MAESSERNDDEPVDVVDYESLPLTVSLGTQMTAGAVAGILEHTVMYPVDSVKVRKRGLLSDTHTHTRTCLTTKENTYSLTQLAYVFVCLLSAPV